MIDPIVDLIATLVSIRKACGLTQVELAERMGVSQSNISQIESGAREPRVGWVLRYAAATGARVDIDVKPGDGRGT